ncbi:Atu4866 domain-containing protein [Rhizobium leguminosarum]|nr:hypothetical protein [Rhizobium laguerreae]MBY3362779.1 hypothetical protein [Rhizobium laguerreae]MCA2436662.1 Atu4866 domain-containing protein [Rhizobium leguminosarum]NEH73494.1 hypothetical protein [Rhizobium leguminosarum]
MHILVNEQLAALVGRAAYIAPQQGDEMTNGHKLKTNVGTWVTEDGYIRQELLPNGRYDEARGTAKSAYQGRYEITGSHIRYWDDTGFTAVGEFINDVLHHVGMRFHRER